MNKFKIGERVRVYATINGTSVSSTCTVKKVERDRLEVQSEFKSFWAHPKQCRHIFRKRHIWVKVGREQGLSCTSNKLDHRVTFSGPDEGKHSEWTLFREVRKQRDKI